VKYESTTTTIPTSSSVSTSGEWFTAKKRGRDDEQIQRDRDLAVQQRQRSKNRHGPGVSKTAAKPNGTSTKQTKGLNVQAPRQNKKVNQRSSLDTLNSIDDFVVDDDDIDDDDKEEEGADDSFIGESEDEEVEYDDDDEKEASFDEDDSDNDDEEKKNGKCHTRRAPIPTTQKEQPVGRRQVYLSWRIQNTTILIRTMILTMMHHMPYPPSFQKHFTTLKYRPVRPYHCRTKNERVRLRNCHRNNYHPIDSCRSFKIHM
jgi:hypothetical protein